MPQKRLADAPL